MSKPQIDAYINELSRLLIHGKLDGASALLLQYASARQTTMQ
jgi:hypothetical protein